ncbi:hypothetical protein GYA44_02995 [Candidatus Microgenomates bacterium]|nr:hypothetical protein [Candidatus Microgenomates bacterium]
MAKVLGILLSVVVILGGGGYLLATKANASAPNDTLFKLDVLLEEAQRLITLDEVAKTELEQEILEERQSEIEAMLNEDGISEELMNDAIEYMNQQRIRTYEKLGEVQEKMEQKGNTQAAESLEKVQNKYMENLQKQLETAQKVQNKFKGIDNTVKEEIEQNMEEEENSLQNEGKDTQNQQQNQESNSNDSSNGSSNGNSSTTKGKSN